MSDDARLAAARRHGLRDGLAERLAGDTPEEIEADAAALAALRPKPPTIQDAQRERKATLLRALSGETVIEEPEPTTPTQGTTSFDGGPRQSAPRVPPDEATIAREHGQLIAALARGETAEVERMQRETGWTEWM